MSFYVGSIHFAFFFFFFFYRGLQLEKLFRVSQKEFGILNCVPTVKTCGDFGSSTKCILHYDVAAGLWPPGSVGKCGLNDNGPHSS